jgi:putative tryptophan/tyrosine transport system substrate-binding protein
MRRREFIAGLGSAVAWPVAARAQQQGMPVIGLLLTWTSATESRRSDVAAFHRGLAETGYIEGRNVAVEYRWTEDRNDRLPDLAADLIRRQVAVIATLTTTPAALAAKAATRTIPIVFLLGTDPTEYGLVTSYARPGGNITGFTVLSKEVIAKRMELLSELVPAGTSIAYMFNPSNFANETEDVQKAARILGVRLLMMDADRQSNIEPAFERMVQQRAGALLMSSDSLFFSYYDQIAAPATHHALPSIFARREAVREGGLMSYGPDIADLARQTGIYTGRILKGEKPADLPVQQPTKFELAINLKTAKALGLTVPQSILLRADEVIE